MTQTIAVIGHGRTPVGRGWGEAIDGCDLVMRMWDCHWQDEGDYGVRYDVGYYELSPKQMSRMKFYNDRTPSKYWVAGLLKTTTDAQPNTKEILMGDWIKLGLELGGVGTTGKLKLTRGCAAACWAITALEPKQVILVGFDNIATGLALSPKEGFPDVYAALPSTSWKSYVGGGTKYHNHDYVAEGSILKTLAAKHQVRLVHAQDVW